MYNYSKLWQTRDWMACAFIIAVGICVLAIYGHSKAVQKTNVATYSLETIIPNQVILVEATRPSDTFQTDYARNLSDGLKDIGRSYEIEGVTPIVSELGNASATTALIVKVKPK